MRGHSQLVAMRRNGYRPAAVWITTDRDAMRCWRDWHEIRPAHAHLEVEPNDLPALLDLRSVIGMQVTVTGSDADRVGAVAEACRQHHAARVIAVQIGPGPHHDVAAITDSEGKLTWPQ